MMENGLLDVPIDIVGQNANVMDGNFLNTTSVTLSHLDPLDLVNQNSTMAGCPLVSMLQGEPVNNFHANHYLANHHEIANFEALIPKSIQFGDHAYKDSSVDVSHPMNNVEASKKFIDAMPISTALLATAASARGVTHENLNKFTGISHLSYPLGIEKNFLANECLGTLNSSFGTSVNCDYDGMLGGLSSTWDFNRCIATEPTGTVSGRTESQSFQLMRAMNSNDWASSENASVSSDTHCSSRFSNEWSSSLATCQPPVIYGNTGPDHCSELSCTVISDRSLIERQLGSEQTSHDNNNLSLGFGSHKSSQVSQLVSGSGYLHMLQEILAEIASYSLSNVNQINYPGNGIGTGTNISIPWSQSAQRGNPSIHADDFADEDDRFKVQMDPVLGAQEVEAKKKHLSALLEVVDDRYNQCLDEVHNVVSAFHVVSDFDPHIHAHFALQTISLLYKKLREKISNYIVSIGTRSNKQSSREEQRSFQTSFIQKQWALQQQRRKEHQLWRPQRGLPERAVSVLQAWMFQNFFHPYPKDAEKQILAVKSGLTRSQVTNWFINARFRLWKPMIEEMYSEMKKRKNRESKEETNSSHRHYISINRFERNCLQ